MIRHVNFFCGDVDKIDIESKQVISATIPRIRAREDSAAASARIASQR
jgi:hypothetical protein